MNDNITLKGEVYYELVDSLGQVKQTARHKNLIVTVGKEWIIDRLGSNTPATCSHIAIGTGTTAPALGDTALQTQTAILNGTTSQPTATSHAVYASFGAGVGTGNITEIGLYASSSALVGRVTQSSVPKTASDTLNVQYTASIS